jgi:hypothetical protein
MHEMIRKDFETAQWMQQYSNTQIAAKYLKMKGYSVDAALFVLTVKKG